MENTSRITVFYITELTDQPRAYNTIIRVLTMAIGVVAARNPHGIQDGIYVYGKEKLRKEFIKLMRKIIKTIESEKNKDKAISEANFALGEEMKKFTHWAWFQKKQEHRKLIKRFKSTNKKIYRIYYGPKLQDITR